MKYYCCHCHCSHQIGITFTTRPQGYPLAWGGTHHTLVHHILVLEFPGMWVSVPGPQMTPPPTLAIMFDFYHQNASTSPHDSIISILLLRWFSFLITNIPFLLIFWSSGFVGVTVLLLPILPWSFLSALLRDHIGVFMDRYIIVDQVMFPFSCGSRAGFTVNRHKVSRKTRDNRDITAKFPALLILWLVTSYNSTAKFKTFRGLFHQFCGKFAEIWRKVRRKSARESRQRRIKKPLKLSDFHAVERHWSFLIAPVVTAVCLWWTVC